MYSRGCSRLSSSNSFWVWARSVGLAKVFFTRFLYSSSSSFLLRKWYRLFLSWTQAKQLSQFLRSYPR